MGSLQQLGSGQSQSSGVNRVAVSSPAQPGTSSMDQYFMPPHLAPPPGYLSMHNNAEPLPRAPSCHQSSGKHRKTEESTNWQGIKHLRNIGSGEDMRLSTRCGPDYVVVHGVPQQCKRWLEDMVKPVPGFEYIKFYNPQTCNTDMAVLTFANRAAAERGFNELFHYFSASPAGMGWKPERLLLVNRTHLLPPRERTIKLKALIAASNPDHKDVPANAAPTGAAGEMPPPVPCEMPRSSVPSFPEAKQPPLPLNPDQAPLAPGLDEPLPPPPPGRVPLPGGPDQAPPLPPPLPHQAPLPGGPDQALPPLPTSPSPPLPPLEKAAPPLPNEPVLPPWAEGTTAAGRPVPWKSAAEKAMPLPRTNCAGAAEPQRPWANRTTAVTDLPPHLQKAVERQPPTADPSVSGVPHAPGTGVTGRLAGNPREARSSGRPTPRKQPTGRRPVPTNSQPADQDAAKESSSRPTSTRKPAQPKASASHGVSLSSGHRSSSQERTGDLGRRSPSLDMSLRGQVSRSISLERRPSQRKSADRTRRDNSERPRRSPSPRRTRSRSASLDRRHSGRKSAEGRRRDGRSRSRRSPSPTRPRDRSRTGRDRDVRERPHSARTDATRERERRSADRRVASERQHSARRSRSPDRRRGSGSREMERLRADKRSPERPPPRSRSVQRRSGSPELRQSNSVSRPTPKVEPLPPPPSRAGRSAAERQGTPAKQRKPGSATARKSQSSASAHDKVECGLSNGPSGERAGKRPRLQMSAADLPGPKPLESVTSGGPVLKQEEGGTQIAAAAQDKAQPGASSQRQAQGKRPRESPVYGCDGSANKQHLGAAADTASKRIALDRSSNKRMAAQQSAPFLSQTAALKGSQHTQLQHLQSDVTPAAAPAMQLSSPGNAKAQAHRAVAVADDCSGLAWQAAAGKDRRVWVDNQPRCAEQMSDQPHLPTEAWPGGGESPWLGDQRRPAQIDFDIRDSTEQRYSTAEGSNMASHSGGDRMVHTGKQPLSLDMNHRFHGHPRDPFSMQAQAKQNKRSREYSQGLPSCQDIDVGAFSDMHGPSLLHDGTCDLTQASNVPSPHRDQLYGKFRHENAPISHATFNGSKKKKDKQAGTSPCARNKQAMVKGKVLETLPEELSRRIHHLLARDDLRPEHFTKTIMAKLAALELPFAHKTIDRIMDVRNWSTVKSIPSRLGQLIKKGELEASRELSPTG